MKFKNLNRQYQTLKPAIDQAVREVLGSQDFILGEHVRKLEKELAAFTHRRHCITCASGSDALLLSLMAPKTPSSCRTSPTLPPPLPSSAPAPFRCLWT